MSSIPKGNSGTGLFCARPGVPFPSPFQARALVTVFGGFVHEPVDQRRQHHGHLLTQRVQGRLLFGDVGMHQAQGIFGLKRRATSQQVVKKGAAQGVKIGTVVQRPVHAAGLLGEM